MVMYAPRYLAVKHTSTSSLGQNLCLLHWHPCMPFLPRIVVKGRKGQKQHGALELPVVISQSDDGGERPYTHALYSKP